MKDLQWIDWSSLQNKNFKKDLENPERFENYQAEALVKTALPVDAILGIGCFNDVSETEIKKLVADRSLQLQVIKRPGWYF